MKRIAVYAGSFDPPTKGHLWMIEQGVSLFDELVVVLAVNPEKGGYLNREVRLDLLKKMCAHLPQDQLRFAVVDRGFLVDFAHEVGASFLLRGLRNGTDFEYEKSMARMNTRMEPDIRSVFLMAPSEFDELSSSFVRGFTGVQGWERWVAACVPTPVYDYLLAHKSPSQA